MNPLSSPMTQLSDRRRRCLAAGAAGGAAALLAVSAAGPAQAATGQSCNQVQPVSGSTQVRLAPGVTVIKPPATVAPGTQLVVGARYAANSPYKSVYAFTTSTRGGKDIGMKFFSGSGSSLRCATIDSKLPAGTTRYIQYQLVPKKLHGKRTAVYYKVTVAG